MKRTGLLLLLALLAGIGGCAHVLSRDSLQKVDKGIDYTAVAAAPENHLGKTLILGGLIVDASGDREGTSLEVVRYLVDRWGEPRRVDPGGGRFLAVSDAYLDPELYQPGLFVTLTGTVTGTETRTLHEAPYNYPVFKIGEIRPWWREPPAYFYGRAYYYGPYYYYPWGTYAPYWDHPFWWHDPYWPSRRHHKH